MGENYLFFNSRDEFLRIDISKIVYFEASGNYTNIILANKIKGTISMNLGAYIKPFRTYVSASSLRRIKKGVFSQRWTDASKMRASVNSWLGVLSHYDSYCLRRTLFGYKSGVSSCGKFSSDWLRFE